MERGTPILLMSHDGLGVSAWVCHSTKAEDGCRLGSLIRSSGQPSIGAVRGA